MYVLVKHVYVLVKHLLNSFFPLFLSLTFQLQLLKLMQNFATDLLPQVHWTKPQHLIL